MKILKKTLITTALCLGLNVHAAIDSEGWFYSAYWTTEGPSSVFLVGAFASEEQCNLERNADFDGSDYRIPWAGGPGCHYIHEREIELANDLYGISQPYNPVIRAERNMSEIRQFLDDVEQLEKAYNMSQFKQELRLLMQRTVNQ